MESKPLNQRALLKIKDKEMLGELSENQIEKLLASQFSGRLACSNDGIPYIVPIHYHYQEGNILAHSVEGKKILMMRKNPVVCFQVDRVIDVYNWESVIAWGRFEEILDMEEKAGVMDALRGGVPSLYRTSSRSCSHGLAGKEETLGQDLQLIFYRIVVVMKTGRFERH